MKVPTASLISWTGVIALASSLVACGGTTDFAQAPARSVPDAVSHACFTPGTSPQTVALPAAGGFSGSLAIGASVTAATSCDVTITLATGAAADAALAAGRGDARTEHRDVPASAKPILQISLDNAFTNDVEVNGATLNTPSDLNFPSGTYYAVVTTGSGATSTLEFTANNGVLTLANNGRPVIVIPGTTATLSLYGNGVTPPPFTATATPTPGASSSASASPTATPSAGPSPTGTPTQAPTPTPSPTTPATVTGYVSISPSTCIAFGYGNGSQTYSAGASGSIPQSEYDYQWSFSPGDGGTLTYPTGSQTNLGGIGITNSTTATFTAQAPAPPNGTTGSVMVTLWYYNSTYGDYEPVETPNGAGQANASAPWAEGSSTCPSGSGSQARTARAR